MNRRWALATFLSAASFIILFAAAALEPPLPRFLWNASASAPIGLYYIQPYARIGRGDLLAILPPPRVARFLAERHYLPRAVPLLKHLAALPGARLCRHDSFVMINGRIAARAKARDREGRALPVWRGCHRLRTDELFLLNAAPDSLDGRYFGPLPIAGLLGRAVPILTRDAQTSPLRWRFACAKPSSKSQQEGMPLC